MTEISEGELVLRFDVTRLIKWDESPAFLGGLRKHQGTKAVDVCADLGGTAAYVEVKDFVGASIWLEDTRLDAAIATVLESRIRSALKPHINAKVIVTSIHLEKHGSLPLQWLRVTRTASGKPRRR